MPQIPYTRFWNNKRSFVSILTLTAFLLLPAYFYAAETPLIQYLNQKSLSNYEKALEIIEEWTIGEKDPVIIETNVFRIYEILKYPELIDKAIGAYKNILENSTVKNDHSITARINIFLNLLYLRKGSVDEALQARRTLGFIDNYKTIGPFKNGDFNLSYLPEKELSLEDSARIFNKDEWFDTQTDPGGGIDAADLFSDISKSVLYFKNTFSVPSDGGYILRLGKTGYTDIWLDGSNVFSSREKHGFAFDQYCIHVTLSEGKHILLIKTGDSKSGLQFALRLTDEKGRATGNSVSENAGESASAMKSKFRNITFFDSLENSIKIRPMEKRAAFNTAYLYYISGINSEYDGEAKTLFAKAEAGALYSVSNYYLGLLAGENEKEYYFNKSLGAFKENIESIYEIAGIKLRNNLDVEAYRLAESIKEINPHSFYVNKLKARIFESRGWHFEVLKEAYPSKNRVNSCGYAIEADVYLKNKKFNKALMPCKMLYNMDKYNITNLNNLTECYVMTGRYDEALGLLSQSSAFFPNNVKLRLKHARLIGNTKDPASSLPYLLHARKMSPCNKDVLLDIGLLYHKLDKEELALLYLNMAIERDPGNGWIVALIDHIKRGLDSRREPSENNLSERSKTGKLQYRISNEDLKIEKSFKERMERESEVFKSIFFGDDIGLFNSVVKLLYQYPAGPDSLLYYREIGKLSRIAGQERCVQALLKLIDSVNSVNSLEKKNLHILYLQLELERLCYRFKISDARKYSEQFFPVKKWVLFGPYFKYGRADIDFPFMPEIITNLKGSDIKRKEIFVRNTKGELDFNRYLYTGEGIAYAVTTIRLNQPVKIRIYSDSSYKLFLNGKEALRNLKSGISRTCRIIKVRDTDKITLMIKLHLKENSSHLRILTTDENDRPLKTESGNTEFAFSDVRFTEEMDYPYEMLRAQQSGGSGDYKSGVNYKLGRYFQGLGSREALKFYRNSLDSHGSDNHIRLYFLAACLLEMSNRDKESADYAEGMDIISNLVKKYPDFIPACRILLKENFKNKSLHEIDEEVQRLLKKGKNCLQLKLDYASYLLNANLEKEFLKEAKSLKCEFPDAVEPLILLASYYKGRDIFRSIELYKTLLIMDTYEVALGELINIYKQMERYREIKALMEIYDTEGYFRKELIEALKDMEDYNNARKAIFQGLAENDDPYYHIKLGEVNYLNGFDPAMYWQKALSVNPSNYSLRDYLNYLETGTFNHDALKKAGSDRFDKTNFSSVKDIKDFIFWYRGLLEGAFNVEADRVKPLFFGKTPDEQIKSVYKYVNRNIELEGALRFSPHSAIDTLYKKSGSAEDKTILALSMLAELGIKSYVAFSGMNEFPDNSGFSQEIFTNILLYVPIDVNTGFWMDFSDTKFEPGEIDGTLYGKKAVVLIKDGYEIKKIIKQN